MPIEVQVHSTFKRAVLICGFAILLCVIFIGARKLAHPRPPPEIPRSATVNGLAHPELLVPVVDLRLEDASREAQWSAALAKLIGAETEASLSGGRVDVLSRTYAIEVDRLDNWHEAIGQALHYAGETGKLPCVALIVASDMWPLNSTTEEKLRLIDKTCLSKGLKLVLLRRGAHSEDLTRRSTE